LLRGIAFGLPTAALLWALIILGFCSVVGHG
jgi:hypothetical protein